MATQLYLYDTAALVLNAEKRTREDAISIEMCGCSGPRYTTTVCASPSCRASMRPISKACSPAA